MKHLQSSDFLVHQAKMPKGLTKLKSSWSAPSNIALVKYWGKRLLQIPENPSISFTLSDAKTITSVELIPLELEHKSISFQFLFDGKEKASFNPKIEKFLSESLKYLPFLSYYHLIINSTNTFPHSSGIASSASAMCALAACLVDLERQLSKISLENDFFNKKVSFLARLGSGSACRSVWGPIVSWGEYPQYPKGTNLYASPVEEVSKIFKSYRDSILLVDENQKQISSTAGHHIMNHHMYKEVRYEQAGLNFKEILKVLSREYINDFIRLVEQEALTLHGMMMTSNPYYILMKPNTLHIIQEIWHYREKTSNPICFTLDAGANVHLLYPHKYQKEIRKFINLRLLKYCKQNKCIHDKLGGGIIKL